MNEFIGEDLRIEESYKRLIEFVFFNTCHAVLACA
jgi:hypothetical protein